MYEKAKLLINGVIFKKNIKGIDKDCKYFPCHDELEDCSFCYCPFYPCNNPDTGGFEKNSSSTGKKVWACSSCTFIHKKDYTRKILDGLTRLNSKIELISRKDLLKLRELVLNQKSD